MEKNKYQRLQQGKSLRYVCNNTATNREQGEIITPRGLKEIFLSKNIMATAIKAIAAQLYMSKFISLRAGMYQIKLNGWICKWDDNMPQGVLTSYKQFLPINENTPIFSLGEGQKLVNKLFYIQSFILISY